jgi:hypothetical protein
MWADFVFEMERVAFSIVDLVLARRRFAGRVAANADAAAESDRNLRRFKICLQRV